MMNAASFGSLFMTPVLIEPRSNAPAFPDTAPDPKYALGELLVR